MPSVTSKHWATLLLAGCALYFLYFFGLARTGMLGPDEPRYAAIGRAMADTRDWVTPRLWGTPWYEKPALLYWMTAVAFKAGLSEDLAPRLPVALMSALFLIFFYLVLRGEFDPAAALFSTVILATSAGWLAYSHVGIPDLPMSATFAGSMLLVLGTTTARRPLLPALGAGVLLGVAVLAKGLVPLALFVPAVWWLRHRLRDLSAVLASATVVCAPWYALVIARNGQAFIDEFFWKQHFARIGSEALMHVRPVWFYIPVLLAALFPWTPLLLTLFRRSELYRDSRVRFLLAWFAWGFVLFSAALNKLPGYLLPLLPALAAVLGVLLARSPRGGRLVAGALAASAILLALLPAVEAVLPQMLLSGLSHTRLTFPLGFVLPALVLAAVCVMLERKGMRELAVSLIAIGICAGVVGFVFEAYPVLNATVSPRAFWKAHSDSITCVPATNRSWRYGLSYYAGRNLPDCN